MDHHIEYMKRNYADWNTRQMSEYDIKLANMVKKIREKYANIYQTRPHTILIDSKPLAQRVPPPPPLPSQQPQVPTAEPKVPKAPTPVVAVATCTAITIKTNTTCGRKVKEGSCFCGLHSKKAKTGSA